MPCAPIRIAHAPQTLDPRTHDTLTLLGQLLSVTLILDDETASPASPVIRFASATTAGPRVMALRAPELVLPARRAAQMERFTVRFANDPAVPSPFRGRTVSSTAEWSGGPLRLVDGERALAEAEIGPLWSVSERPGGRLFRSALLPPPLGPEEGFADVFNGGNFLGTLPLLHFMRTSGAARQTCNAPLRASFIIDDPNLHWPSYGFVDYRQVASAARCWDFHVGFATIPLDTWFTHARAAALFREHRDQLSLLVHGNNHSRHELARNYDDNARAALLNEAMVRIDRLERRTGVGVCKVMVPPHGACSSRMLGDLPAWGYESACISTGSLRAHNPGQHWTRTAGYRPSESVNGCSVLPRWGLDANVGNAMLLAAYLGQAMVVRGHHQDLRDGPERLIEIARFINAMGTVLWADMQTLSRLNYQWRLEGATLVVTTMANRLHVELPSEAHDVMIESPVEDTGPAAWHAGFGAQEMSPVDTLARIVVQSDHGPLVLVRHPATASARRAASRFPRPSVRFMVRRLLTEARDRMLMA